MGRIGNAAWFSALYGVKANFRSQLHVAEEQALYVQQAGIYEATIYTHPHTTDTPLFPYSNELKTQADTHV